MTHSAVHPPFGAADLSNCEREQIHLAGSIQPHGALLVLRESDLCVLQASVNTEQMLGVAHAALVGRGAAILGGDFAQQVAATAKSNLLMVPTPLRCTIGSGDAARCVVGAVHRQPRSGLVVEIDGASDDGACDAAAPRTTSLPHELVAAVAAITTAPSVGAMSDAVVQHVRQLTGYDRVMVYQFDADGHGEVVAEARDTALEPLLGQHYPASDIPQRARELYLRNRVRVLVDVHYEPVPIMPRHSPVTGEDLDMSHCGLRSMSPLHLQYLRNMGVTATLVASLVRDGRLWGLIACHHYSAKAVASETRAACELLSEVVSTRISALENRAQVEAELFVRGLEHRLVSYAQETGDWRDALFTEPDDQLLGPLDADGAALFYGGELLLAGETPSRAELRALAAWLEAHMAEPLYQTVALGKANPELATLAATATGVLAIELSRADGEFLVWFRKEQIRTVTWAGNPDKAMVIGNDPRDLSPRRSFAAWQELVRDTARPWAPAQLAIAAAIRGTLVDIILQMRALRALIADRHASLSLGVIESAGEPMILANGAGDVLIVNSAFHRLVERPLAQLRRLEDLPLLAADQGRMREMLQRLHDGRQSWRGELRLQGGMQGDVPVAVRADPVPGLDGMVIGYILIFTDLRHQREARAVRARLERAIAESQVGAPLGGVAAMMAQDFDKLLSAVLANASAAIVQITDTSGESSTGALLKELETATRRAADLTTQILGAVSQIQRSS